jgi:hypothetical protein
MPMIDVHAPSDLFLEGANAVALVHQVLQQ